MDLIAKLRDKKRKTICEEVVAWVGNDATRFDELLNILLSHPETMVVQYSAWPLSNCVQNHPTLIQDKLELVLPFLKEERYSDTIVRNILRLLQYVDIPEDYEGEILEPCMKFIECPTAAVGIKAFAINIASKLAVKYPDLIPELTLLIESQIANAKPGFVSSGKRALRLFDKLER